MSSAEQSSEVERRVIKRYSNRKLYDTRDSRYVTLQQIGEMVRRGEDVQIIDNKTKEDKTEVTLALILSEDLKNKPRSVPLAALRELIQERSDRLMSQLRDGPFGRLMPGDGEAPEGEAAEGSVPAPESEVVPAPESVVEQGADESAEAGDKRNVQQRINEWMDSSRQSLDQLQARVDEGLRSLPGLALVHEVHELRATVAKLQARIEVLEKAAGVPVPEASSPNGAAEATAAAEE